MIVLFTKLLLAHLIGDFVLQPSRWVIHKEANKIKSKYLYIHVLLHFVLAAILVWDTKVLPLIAIVAVSHFVIDVLKLYSTSLFKRSSIPFFIDQLLHLIVLYVVVYFPNLSNHIHQFFATLDWVLVTAVIFVTYPAAIIMAKLLEGLSDQIELDHRSLSNAGTYIGILERLFVLTFIMLQKWEAIGLLIAAKSVFRFNDLKESNNRKLTEYILIGTLLSFGLAVLAGILYQHFKL